ncbi:universal stress protein [Streptomyces sp. NBC_00557]|uniref:universal stress protein n=1 Tax=Streptomyces sp. NBC_00557 TaxID=2975776 RepID=UPI002E80BBB4|nr:universal stress protein [Streptomyces sp. NBC_00557]WUC37244.1 universal stress protein [Streptomyces sp. NBC_00557]
MSRVIIACANGTGRSHTAVDWAAHEASLRDLPLEVRYGSPPNDLSTTAMLVLDLSATGDDTTGLATGPAALAVTAASACPVVLIPDADVPVAAPARRVTQVTLGIDARHPAEQAIDFAFGAAQVRGVRLHAVHAWKLPSCAAGLPFGVPEADRATWEDHEVQLLGDALRPWRVKYPRVPVLEDVVLLNPVEALIHHAEAAALLVVGRGASGTPGVVQALLREAQCPVALVP